jgi:inorganic pyrophosphatase
MNPWHDVKLDMDDRFHLDTVIEIPAGSKIKYEIDKDNGLF